MQKYISFIEYSQHFKKEILSFSHRVKGHEILFCLIWTQKTLLERIFYILVDNHKSGGEEIPFVTCELRIMLLGKITSLLFPFAPPPPSGYFLGAGFNIAYLIYYDMAENQNIAHNSSSSETGTMNAFSF